MNVNKSGFLNALGALVYIVIVSSIMQNADKLFGKADNYIGAISFLLLFTLSAFIVGGLVVGKPIMLYIDDKKKEAISLFVTTSAWLAAFTAIAMIIAALLK